MYESSTIIIWSLFMTTIMASKSNFIKLYAILCCGILENSSPNKEGKKIIFSRARL